MVCGDLSSACHPDLRDASPGGHTLLLVSFSLSELPASIYMEVIVLLVLVTLLSKILYFRETFRLYLFFLHNGDS